MQTLEPGTLRKWVEEKGYGFIYIDGRGDLFVHASSLSGDIPIPPPVGLRVLAMRGHDRDGRPCAIACEPLEV